MLSTTSIAAGKSLRVFGDLAQPFDRRRPAHARQVEREQHHRDDLRDVGLRSRDTDLGAAAREQRAVGDAREMRADDVADAEDRRAGGLRDRQASIVSAVSPDCDIAIVSVRGSMARSP